MSNNQARYVAQEKFNLWPQAHLHTQWPGGTSFEEAAVRQLTSSQIASIKSFHRQQELNTAGLMAMPILVLTSEASYHAPYDHCTVRYLRQAGLHPSWIKLAERGIRGNSHVMMMEKNSRQIASVIIGWTNKAIPAKTRQLAQH